MWLTGLNVRAAQESSPGVGGPFIDIDSDDPTGDQSLSSIVTLALADRQVYDGDRRSGTLTGEALTLGQVAATVEAKLDRIDFTEEERSLLQIALQAAKAADVEVQVGGEARGGGLQNRHLRIAE